MIKQIRLSSVLLTLMSLLSCSNTQISNKQSVIFENPIEYASHAFSFLIISGYINQYCTNSYDKICNQITIKATASGVIVTKNNSKRSIKVLTANHFCEDHMIYREIIKHDLNGNLYKATLTTSLSILDYAGHNFKDIKISKINITNDLCVVDAVYDDIS